MTVVVPAFATPVTEQSSVRLCTYAQYIGYDERAFFGLRYDTMVRTACRDVWTKMQRDMIAHYLWEAQFEIEQQLMFTIGERWIADAQPWVDDQDLTRHPNVPAKMTRFQYVIEPGVRAVADIALAVVPDYTSDPAEIIAAVPAGMSTLTESEVTLYLPGLDTDIVPSSIVIAAGVITIQVPWSRMVDAAHADNPSTGWDYTDTGITGPYAQTVDVKRVYTDTTTQAVLTRKTRCRSCETTTGTGCIRVYQPKLGIILIVPDVYQCTCYPWEKARLYYKAGMPMTPQAQEAIIRLAHSKMHTSPCGCDPAQVMWKEDRAVPRGSEWDLKMCPFGVSHGAIQAWKWTQNMWIPRVDVM